MKRNVELVHKIKCDLGEAPLWHSESQYFYWVDIMNFRLYRLDTRSEDVVTYNMPSEISCFAFGGNGLIYVVLADGLYSFDESTGALVFLSRPDDLEETHRFNDGKCDSAGRFYMGSMEKTYTNPTGSLYSVDSSMKFSKHVDRQFVVPNGLSWNNELEKFYHVDTVNGKVNAYDYDHATGAICNGKTIITVKSDEGSPDGMTIDDEGMLWICHWDGYKIVRWNPLNGEKLEEIQLAVERPTSCCFGGPDMKDLYITSAAIDDAKGDLSGSVFKVKLDVGGSELYKFKV